MCEDGALPDKAVSNTSRRASEGPASRRITGRGQG